MVLSLLLLTPSHPPPSSIHGNALKEGPSHSPKQTEDLVLWDLSFWLNMASFSSPWDLEFGPLEDVFLRQSKFWQSDEASSNDKNVQHCNSILILMCGVTQTPQVKGRVSIRAALATDVSREFGVLRLPAHMTNWLQIWVSVPSYVGKFTRMILRT